MGLSSLEGHVHNSREENNMLFVKFLELCMLKYDLLSDKNKWNVGAYTSDMVAVLRLTTRFCKRNQECNNFLQENVHLSQLIN